MQEKFHFQAKGMPLIKFQDADKIKSFQSGKVYAKTLGYYRKREEEILTKLRSIFLILEKPLQLMMIC